MFYADLHVHSKFSRATGREADLEHYAHWARKKGIAVVATGDFTHPAWRAELREKLVPAEPGLFRLRDDLERAVVAGLDPHLTALNPEPTRFILEVEISTIYKKGDRTRKVHHLVLVPDLGQADRLTVALSRIGNLNSDGRPILGLDSRNLLELTLQSGDQALLIPAHIWTPWFSALGSMSGFDAIADCYGDLAPHIHAVETGLSSDPAMNWRVSSLDRYRLVSNSDAHSPGKLAREACIFDGPMSYAGIRDALVMGTGYTGTVEFFPEEGKYHLDGHRKCSVCFTPDETQAHHGLCPGCGKPLTIGVMNRVAMLADRPDGARAANAGEVRSLVPLPEVLGEMLRCGPDSGKVTAAYEATLATLGPELGILNDLPLDAIAGKASALLAEGIDRMRRGQVIRDAGYDGEYGVIRLFTDDELKGGVGATMLMDIPAVRKPRPKRASPAPGKSLPAGAGRLQGATPTWSRRSSAGMPVDADCPPAVAEDHPAYDASPAPPAGPLDGLDADQRMAAAITSGPLLIVAGPGTGKTRTLTHRLAYLIREQGVAPDACLAVTFTNRAAHELRERLARLLPQAADRITVTTFHGLGYRMLAEQPQAFDFAEAPTVIDESGRTDILRTTCGLSAAAARRLLKYRRRHETPPEPALANALACYNVELRARGCVDFDNLIDLPLDWLRRTPEAAARYRERYPWVSVDEYQDIDARQYELIRLLVPPAGNLCAIGDPDQAIYGFRGGDVSFFQRFATDFPAALVVSLNRNYRSGKTIVEAAGQMIAPASLVADRHFEAQIVESVNLVMHEATTDKSEAEFVVHSIEQLVGGASFFSMDSGRVGAGATAQLSFADFAVLYRTDAQSVALVEALERSGMPYQKRSHAPLSEQPAVRAVLTALKPSEDESMSVALEAALTRCAADGLLADLSRLTPTLRRLAAESSSHADFRSRLAMASDVDALDPRADAIALLTLHASKGLEYPVVFITGCEDGVLPLRWPGGDDVDTAEERRLLFVGMTRARQRLFLSHARKRLWNGEVRDMQPSPFLRDIEERLLDREQTRRKTREGGQQLVLF